MHISCTQNLNKRGKKYGEVIDVRVITNKWTKKKIEIFFADHY